MYILVLVEPVTTPCVCTTLRMTTRTIKRLYDQALAPAGLTQTSYAILSRLDAEGPFSISELAARLALERTTCSRELEPLARARLVQRGVGADRRQRIIELTPMGRERLERARPLWRVVQDRVSAAFGVDQTEELLARLRDLLSCGDLVLA